MSNPLLHKVREKALLVDALSARERALLFAVVATVLTVLWYGLLMQPLITKSTAVRQEISAMRDRIEVGNRALEEQVLQYSSVDGEQNRRMAELEQQIDAINQRLSDYAAELIDPAEMARVLEDVLAEQSKLKLIRVRNLDAEPVAGTGEAQATTLYRHGLEIELEGGYLAVMDYLNEIEALPWRLYWQLMEFTVEDFPRNRVRIRVSTLSLNEEWIGA